MSIVFGSAEAAAIVAANRALEVRTAAAARFEEEHGCTIQEKLEELQQIIDELESERDALESEIESKRTIYRSIKALEATL